MLSQVTKNQNMKKLFIVACVIAMIAGCQKKSETEKASEVVMPADMESQPMSQTDYDQWQAMHIIKPCEDEVYILSEKRHNIEFDEFKKSAEEIDTSGQIIYHPKDGITLENLIKECDNRSIKCYDGWLEVKYDGSTNDKISFTRSDIYDSYLCLYSEPLLQGILKRTGLANAKDITVHFAKIKIGVMRSGGRTEQSKLGMRVTYKPAGSNDTVELFYDMSDDPL